MNEENKKILLDFTGVMVEEKIGEYVQRDLSKPLGNSIHQRVGDIGLDEIARKIYHEGKIEVDEKMAVAIKSIIENGDFVLFIRQALCKVVDEAMKK